MAGSTIAEYAYDATNRRIWKKTHLGGEHDNTEHFYYHRWSLVEVRNGSGTVIQQHVWDSLAGHYIDSLAQTLNDTNESLDGVLEDELYALQDQQYNVLALIDDQGDIVERYEYSLYGERIVMNANYAVLSRSARGMHLGFQGLMHDTESGLIHNRLRPYAPDLHRFLTRDPHPSLYPDGLNTYAAYHVMWGGLDPTGMIGAGVNTSAEYTRQIETKSGYFHKPSAAEIEAAKEAKKKQIRAIKTEIKILDDTIKAFPKAYVDTAASGEQYGKEKGSNPIDVADMP